MSEQITMSVDSNLANMYRSASDDERRKPDLIINLRLRDAIESKKSCWKSAETRNAGA